MINKPNPIERLVRNEIELKEAEARDLKQWLVDHPDAGLENKAEVRRRLMEALQAINDLVCKLKPGKIYTIR